MHAYLDSALVLQGITENESGLHKYNDERKTLMVGPVASTARLTHPFSRHRFDFYLSSRVRIVFDLLLIGTDGNVLKLLPELEQPPLLSLLIQITHDPHPPRRRNRVIMLLRRVVLVQVFELMKRQESR